MFLRAAVIWVIGLLTVVPGGTYYLFFHAQREQYAFLITLVLFWIFGYWSVVGPLLAAIKVQSLSSHRASHVKRRPDESLAQCGDKRCSD